MAVAVAVQITQTIRMPEPVVVELFVSFGVLEEHSLQLIQVICNEL